jgi:hypothetical protein
MKHFNKLNAKGFAHWVIPALAIVVIGGIGSYLLTQSHADDLGNPLSSKKICENAYYNRTWTGSTCSKTCQPGYSPATANPYDYCKKLNAHALCGSGFSVVGSPRAINKKGGGGEVAQLSLLRKSNTLCAVMMTKGEAIGKATSTRVQLDTFTNCGSLGNSSATYDNGGLLNNGGGPFKKGNSAYAGPLMQPVKKCIYMWGYMHYKNADYTITISRNFYN